MVGDRDADTVTMRSEEWLALKRDKLISGIERESRQRVMNWFALLFVAGTIVGAIGVPTLVRITIAEMVETELQPEIEKAEAATDAAAEAAASAISAVSIAQRITEESLAEILAASNEAKARADEALRIASDQTSEVQGLIARVTATIEELDEELRTIEGKTEQVRTQVDVMIVQVQSNLTEIARALPDPEPAQRSIADSDQRISEVRSRGETTIQLVVPNDYPPETGDTFVDALRDLGFTVTRPGWSRGTHIPEDSTISVHHCCLSDADLALVFSTVEALTDVEIIDGGSDLAEEGQEVVIFLEFAGLDDG